MYKGKVQREGKERWDGMDDGGCSERKDGEGAGCRKEKVEVRKERRTGDDIRGEDRERERERGAGVEGGTCT